MNRPFAALPSLYTHYPISRCLPNHYKNMKIIQIQILEAKGTVLNAPKLMSCLATPYLETLLD